MAPLQKSNILVTLQFILIAVLLITTISYKFIFIAILLIIASIGLVIWAITAMKKSKIIVSPIPSTGAKLIVEGPYRYIRHPMYTSILLGVAGLLLMHFTWLRVGISLVLFIVLIVKLNWEEIMLINKFPEYRSYMKHTKRIFPFIY